MADTIFAGLIHGNLYALVALGLSLVFGVTNVANFAHGSVFALGTMTGWWFAAGQGWPWWAALLGTVVVTGLVGLAVNITVVRPLGHAPPVATLLATVAAAMILDNLSQIVFGTRARVFPPVLPTHDLRVGGLSFGTSDIVTFAVTLSAMAALAFYLKRGRSGQAIRATAQDIDAAVQMGIPAPRIQNLAFAIASALGGTAGFFMGLFNSTVSPTSGASAGFAAFAAAALGGLGSMPGAVVGGFALGLAEAVGVRFFGDGVRDLVTFGSLLVVLMIRPGGLFGRVPLIAQEPLTGSFLAGGRPIRLRWQQGALALAAAAVFPAVASSYVLAVSSQIALYAIAAVGLSLITGGAGQVVLGQAGSIAIGAYASALLVGRAGWPFLGGLVAAGLIAAVISSVLAFPVWRLAGHSAAIATLGLGTVTVAVIRNWDSLTKGAYGLSGIPFPSFFGLSVDTPVGIFYLDLVCLALAVVIVTRLTWSRLGRAIGAVGADEVAARSAGVAARDHKALAFAVAAFFAGLAGALSAHQYTYIDPTSFPQSMSILVLVIAVLGGLRSPAGAIVGSVILIGGPEILRLVPGLPDVRVLLYGVLLLAIIRFRPQGLWTRRS
ncbi:MAG: ABC transporter permease [Propionibacteriaceae bacterium]|jgi:branched-chain amino acid transport system permease protein|nr:ABC transporter permease [Propionibacteriaceae bacterium]